MKLTKVDWIPEPGFYRDSRTDRSITKVLKEFMADPDMTFAHVSFEPGEYLYPHSCRSSFDIAIKRGNFPVKVYIRQHEVYLSKILWSEEY